MSKGIDNQNIEVQQSGLPEITSREELLAKLKNINLQNIRKKEKGDTYEITTEIDDIYRKKGDTFLIKKELFDNVRKEQEKQLATQAVKETTNAEKEKL
ncbi:MAG: hypothetical protein LBH96_02035 [Candidatus Peribacteria bacterium]|jgi:hypothetical protein|nr:hypothetical protein [Candidatus Peribacteria bacterium]